MRWWLIVLVMVGLFIWAKRSYAQAPKPYTTLGPYPTPHEGILMGNGYMGVEVFGDSTLNLSVSLAGAWQRNGVAPMDTAITYAKVKALLLAKDEVGLNRLFKRGDGQPKLPGPFQMGGYELRLRFKTKNRVLGSTLDYSSGVLHVHTSKGEVLVVVDPYLRRVVVHDTLWLMNLDVLESDVRTAAQFCRAEMQARGVEMEEHTHFAADTFQLFYPESDSALGEKGHIKHGYVFEGIKKSHTLSLYSGKSYGPPGWLFGRQPLLSYSATASRSRLYWDTFWKSRPHLRLADTVVEGLYNYCLYKAGTVFRKTAPAATLQGPYNESYQLPPWSNDYHFNVNVQMMYGPLAAAGLVAESAPLWDMVQSWLPEMRRLGENFYGRKGAMFMPHAVDEQMHPIGTFWTGMIDPGCLAWLACLSYDQHMYQGETGKHQGLTAELLKGALEAYRAVLEWRTDTTGKRYLYMPISVSPEFRGARMDAWGSNASYQLAAVYGVAQRYARSRKLAGLRADRLCDTIERYLPPYTTLYKESYRDYPGQRKNRIALWDGQDLPESHRHHSHLGAIYPFTSIVPRQAQHLDAVENSLQHWVYTGMGSWTGWCLPWAAIINLRCGRPDAALAQLHWWMDNFVTASGQTTHDALAAGASTAFVAKQKGTQAPGRMFMQLDASFGFVDAVQQMFAYTVGDTVYLAQGIPSKWKDASISNLHLPGGWVASVGLSSVNRAGDITLEDGTVPIWISAPLRGTDGALVRRPKLYSPIVEKPSKTYPYNHVIRDREKKKHHISFQL